MKQMSAGRARPFGILNRIAAQTVHWRAFPWCIAKMGARDSESMPEPENELKHAWLVVALLSIAFVINYVDRQVVFSIFPLLRRDLGFSEAELGAVGTLFTWTYSLAMPFSGRLADIFSRRKLVISSLILWNLATLWTGLSTTKEIGRAS